MLQTDEETLTKVIQFVFGVNAIGIDAGKAATLAANVVDAFTVQDRLASLAQKRRDLVQQYQAKLAEVDKEIAAVRKDCVHPATTYVPDPSGNNDSAVVCDICGCQDVRRKA
jgi:hypothetical protein